MSDSELPPNKAVVPEQSLRPGTAKNEKSPVEMDRRALLRVGMTTAVAGGAVALGLTLRARTGVATTKFCPS
jgi:hypothetical protein